jgi:hypothetical protein
MRSAVSAFLLILMMATSLSWATPEDEARAFADSVLAMKDKKQYREMYRDKFHQSMKSQMTEDQWLAVDNQVDKQTGAMKSRSLNSSDKSMGIYKFRYDTQYENGKAFDDIYVTNDNGWKVIGLWVRPNIQ